MTIASTGVRFENPCESFKEAVPATSEKRAKMRKTMFMSDLLLNRVPVLWFAAELQVVWRLCRPIPPVQIHERATRESRERRALEWSSLPGALWRHRAHPVLLECVSRQN